MTNRIGLNSQDRSTTALGNTLVVVTRDGNVFGSDVGAFAKRELAPVIQFTGAKIGFNPQDRFMMALGSTLVVVTRSGDVFGSDVRSTPTGTSLGITIDGAPKGKVFARELQPAFQFSGAKMGFNPQDRFMVTVGNRLVVVTHAGDVFAADVVGRDIRSVFHANGPEPEKADEPPNPELGDKHGDEEDGPEHTPGDPSPESGPTQNPDNQPPTGCFSGDTPVLMADGLARPIDAIALGDQVMARDERSGVTAGRAVTRVFRHHVAEMLLLRTNGVEVVETTADHRFAAEGRGFVSAGRLRPGDRISTHDGRGADVVSTGRRSAQATVYNLSVDQFQTFFIGGAGLWVHNMKKANPEEPPPKIDS